MLVVFVLLCIVVIAVAALLVVGRLDASLVEVGPDQPPLNLPADRPLVHDDVDAVKFGVGMRGYRMEEVDEVLDRLADEVAARDAQIDSLERRLAGFGVPRPDSLGFDAPVDPHRDEA